MYYVITAVQAAMNLHPEVAQDIIHLHEALMKDEAVVIVTVIVTDIGAVNERAAADEEDQTTGRHRAIVTKAGKEEGVCS